MNMFHLTISIWYKNYINPKIIDIRTKKIEIMEAAMNTDPLIRIQYSAKKSGHSKCLEKVAGRDSWSG